MRVIDKTGWPIARSLVFLSVFSGATSPIAAQVLMDRQPPIQFDIRRHKTLLSTLSGTAVEDSAKIVESRKAMALAAAPESGEPGGVRLSFNNLGFPQAISYPPGWRPSVRGVDELEKAQDYLRANPALFPFSESDLHSLVVSSTSRTDHLTFVTLEQTVSGIPVLGGRIRVTLDSRSRVAHASAGMLVPGATVDNRVALSREEAAKAALRWMRIDAPSQLTVLPSEDSRRMFFAHPDQQDRIAVEPIVFPLGPSSARMAYRVFAARGPRDSCQIVVDASDGSVLYAFSQRKDFGGGTVWKESPTKGPRESVDFPDTWLAPNAATSSGNNIDAYLDRDADNLPDTDRIDGLRNGRAFSQSGMFEFPAGEGSTGQDPRDFAAAAVTNAFYFANAAHDYFYDLGFTETAGNFQVDNFDRGGQGGDPVNVHVHDGEGFDNAFFLGAPEGIAPRIELGLNHLGTASLSDDRDMALDGEVVLHEYAHGVVARSLAGGSSPDCLGQFQSAAFDEGTADYFALSFFNNPILGDYTDNNVVRGIRRHSYEGYPFSYEDLGNEGFEPHNDGEVWTATLWELRKELGAELADRLVMNGLRLTPCSPSLIDARDAVLDADAAVFAREHNAVLWEIFARRGMGFSASGFDGFLVDSNVFNAAFDLPPTSISANRNPVIVGRPTELGETGSPYVYRINASDADGDALEYELLEGPPGSELDASTGRLSFTPSTLVAPRFKVAVTDGRGGRIVHGFTVPVITLLTPGRPLSIEGPAGQQGVAGFLLFNSAPAVQVTLRGAVGDPDLTLLHPDGRVSSSFRFGANETITIANPPVGLWLVLVEATEAYQDVDLSVTFPRASSVALNALITNLRDVESGERFYRFEVPEGTNSFTVSTGGGSGDADLFVARGRYPTCHASFLVDAECDFDDASVEFGNFESITVNGDSSPAAARLRPDEPVTVFAVEAGQWFLSLSAFESYEDVALSVTLDAETTAPKISGGGLVNAASFEEQLSPGSIASLFGSGLASQTGQAEAIPLPRELGGTRVLIGGIAAPLFFVSEGQINFQVPFEALEGQVAVVVERDRHTSAIVAAPVQHHGPGIFTYQRGPEELDPVVIHADGALVSPQNPARAGEVLVVFATGAGDLSNPPATGEAAASNPLAVASVSPEVVLGGAPLDVLFAGLTPGFVGLVQVNVQLPDPLPGSGPLPLVLDFSGVQSQTVSLTVE